MCSAHYDGLLTPSGAGEKTNCSATRKPYRRDREIFLFFSAPPQAGARLFPNVNGKKTNA